MQKKLIALAIAGLASSAAFAQSNVTIYGSVDVGVAFRGSENGGVNNVDSRREITSGGSAGNRLGFRGAEDLGNGLKAIFELEYSLDADVGTTSATKWGNRHSYLGLTGGFGTVVAGRLDGVRYGVYGTYDPFANGSMGNFTQMTVQYDRADNAVAYISPKWSGFGLVLAYATNTNGQENSRGYGTGNGNNGDDRLYTIMGTYDNGPISLRVDYETTTTQDAANLAGGKKLYVFTTGGSYDFGVVKIGGVYDVIKGDQSSFIGANTNGLDCANVVTCTGNGQYDRRNWFVSASAPIGKFTLMANYGRVKNKEQNDADASKWAIGAKYDLSKRTNLYTAYSRIKNDDNSTFEISQSAASNGGGHGISGFELGMRHQF